MEPRVFYRVIQGTPNPPPIIQSLYTFTPALLHGYCRHRVKGADYPAIVPEHGQSVVGVYVTGLTDANISKLDQFEGDEYAREPVRLNLLEKVGGKDGEGQVEGEARDTTAYVFIVPESVEKGEWDFEHFRRERMHLWSRDEIFFSDDGA